MAIEDHTIIMMFNGCFTEISLPRLISIIILVWFCNCRNRNRHEILNFSSTCISVLVNYTWFEIFVSQVIIWWCGIISAFSCWRYGRLACCKLGDAGSRIFTLQNICRCWRLVFCFCFLKTLFFVVDQATLGFSHH